ncbi:MAG: polyprenyl synthetase family protein [Halobacteriota archaeon]|nr:polyprenyl synthetase family protein [Halobacteriota archaeon]
MSGYLFLTKSQKIVDKINREIIKYVPEEPLEFSEACRVALTGGKRLRGLVGVYSCLAVGGEEEVALPFATSIELAHASSLVMDDFIDKDEVRRGKPSIHAEYGRDMAILASSYLLGCSYESFYGLVRSDMVPHSVFFNIIGTAHDGVMNACVGEAMDITSGTVGMEGYLRTIERKTGEGFRAAAEIGCIMGESTKGNIIGRQIRQLVNKGRFTLFGEETENNVTALSSYGKNLGISFQIRDDILDVIGSEEMLGKPIWSDIIKGRSSVVLEASILDIIPEEELIKISRDDFEDIEEIREFLKGSEAVDYAQNLAIEYSKKAKSSLRRLVDSEYKSILIEIADFAAKREL